MSDVHWQLWFESIWALREETLYRDYFGDIGKGIYPIPIQAFEQIGIADPDPRFLSHGVFVSPPNEKHADWIYLTSGMSNPWGDSPETASPNGPSGLGCEYVLHTSSSQQWAIQILHWFMAVELAIASGRRTGELVQPGDRVGIGNPIPTQHGTGQIATLLVTTPDAPSLHGPVTPLCYPPLFQLPTGHVNFLLLIGITEKENAFARTQGIEGLLTLLHHHHIFPLTNPARASTL